MTSKRGGARPGSGRPSGVTGAARPQNQLRAHKDEWLIIKRFAELVKKGYKDECLEFIKKMEELKMKRISLNNGNTYISAQEVFKSIDGGQVAWDTIVHYMDDEVRELACREFPNTDEEFLETYLKLAKEDLIIG